MTISQSLAELMDGKITVESTQGEGTCFTVTIPFSIVTKEIFHHEGPPNTVPTWDGNSLRILLVDDNAVNRYLGASLLRKYGHEVITVENGRECIEEMGESTFDIVLMDILMPVMSGEDALHEIRASEAGTIRHQPVIALTSFSLRGDRERFILEGFDGYVSKPMEISMLVAEIKKVLSCG